MSNQNFRIKNGLVVANNLVVDDQGQIQFPENSNTNAATASKLETARTISLTGDVTGSVSFDGSSNVEIETTASGGGGSSLEGFTDTTTPERVAVGFEAGTNTGSRSVSVGYQAASNSTATDITAIGYQTLQNNTGTRNVAVGSYALRGFLGDSSGIDNTGLGHAALVNNTTGNDNTAVGSNALFINQIGRRNVAVGSYALGSNGSGNGNIALGTRAMMDNTSGSENIAMGWYALGDCTSGVYNICIGHRAGRNLTTGSDNILMGANAGTLLTTGYSNIGIGGFGGNGINNVAVGVAALQYGSGGTANRCVAVGRGALEKTIGNNNTGLGHYAGYNLTSGQNNTIIGNEAEPSSATVSNEITLGNGSVSVLRCNATTITSLSDERDKTDIKDLELGVDFVSKIRAVDFEWNSRDGSRKGDRQFGFIAQQLVELQQEFGTEVPGLVYDENPEKLEVSEGRLVPILVKAIAELKQEIEILKGKISNE